MIKTYSKIGKTWFLLAHWVARNGKANENILKQSSRVVLQKKLKISQNSLENTCTGVSF